MKTIYLKVATLVFTFLLLSSCSKDDNPAPARKSVYVAGVEQINCGAMWQKFGKTA